MHIAKLFLSTAMASALSITSVVAQDQSADDSLRIFDTLTVTAQKKAENSQDVPISISTFSGDALNEIGIQNTAEIGELIPGLEVQRTGGPGTQVAVFLRGAGLNDFNTNNAGPIAIYSDEVYISSPVLTGFQFFDVERVEVLKGPQGTLYGRNTTGGAVKFITNKPSDELEIDFRGAYGRFDTVEIESAISGPITDKIRARVAVNYINSDGFVENLVDGENLNGQDTLSWRGIIDFDVTENFTFRGNIHGARDRSESAQFWQQGVLPGGSDFFGYVGPEDRLQGNYNRLDDNELDSIGGYIEMNWDLNGFTVTSVTAYDELDRLYPEDTDASPVSVLDIDYGVESETFTQELRVAGETGIFDWLVGGFFLTEGLDQDQNGDVGRFLRDVPLAFGGTGGLPDPTGAATGGFPVGFFRSQNTQETDTYAIFGQIAVAVTDQLTLTLGGRYTDEEKTFDALGTLDEPLLGGAIPLYQVVGDTFQNDAFSWRFAVDYQATDDVLLYASAARGFKSGGFNGVQLALEPDPLALLEPIDPEFLNAYELGFKTEWFDKALRVNGALYYNDFSDVQVFNVINSGGIPSNRLENAADAEVFGVELDVTAYPLDGFLLNVSTAFQEAELKDFVTTIGDDFSGNTPANTPKWSVSALTRYDHDLGNIGSAHIQGSLAYRSDQFFSTENDPLIGQEAFTVLNARVGWDSQNGQWGIAFFGRNLADKRYLNNAVDISALGWNIFQYAPPRTWGVELTANL